VTRTHEDRAIGRASEKLTATRYCGILNG